MHGAEHEHAKECGLTFILAEIQIGETVLY